MARFKLIINDKEINTLDDLKANFKPEQILKSFQVGSLQRWLAEKKYSAELKEIEALQTQDDDLNLICKIMTIFSFEKNQIEKIVSQLAHKNTEEEDACDDGEPPRDYWCMLHIDFHEDKDISGNLIPFENNGEQKITITKFSDISSIMLHGLFYYDDYFRGLVIVKENNTANMSRILEETQEKIGDALLRVKEAEAKAKAKAIEAKLKEIAGSFFHGIKLEIQKAAEAELKAAKAELKEAVNEVNEAEAEVARLKEKMKYYEEVAEATQGETEKFYAVRSKNLCQWEIDDNLSKKRFKWMDAFYGNQCCYLTPSLKVLDSDSQTADYMKGENQTWSKEKLPCQIPWKDKYRVSAILENSERTGILVVNPNSAPVQSCFLWKTGNNEFKKCSELKGSYFPFVFKDRFFTLSSQGMKVADKNNYQFRALDSDFIPKGEEGIFVFPDILFMLDHQNKLYYSLDGESWNKSSIDTNVKKIICVHGKYFAFSKKEQKSLQIFISANGKKWTHWREILLSNNIDWRGEFNVTAGRHMFLVGFGKEKSDCDSVISYRYGDYLICGLND